MPKLFCVSDIHGFYDEMVKALNTTEFDPKNENHWLISCGDNFDRGPDPEKVMNYMESLPRKVLITGNHEDLLMECLRTHIYYDYDISNGTIETIYSLCNDHAVHMCNVFPIRCMEAYQKVKDFISPMKDYFETKNYIFTHGWIPIDNMSNWRNASAREWEGARWSCGIDMALKGIVADKTIVCGHWHTSYGHHIVDGTPEFGKGANFDPYYGDGIIDIDACTAYSKQVNVLVLEDELIKN